MSLRMSTAASRFLNSERSGILSGGPAVGRAGGPGCRRLAGGGEGARSSRLAGAGSQRVKSLPRLLPGEGQALGSAVAMPATRGYWLGVMGGQA